MREHESRSAILAELHARPFLPVEAPRRVYHFAFATNDAEVRADRRALRLYYDRLCERPAYREHVMVPYDELRVS